jgi:hypothetical protein
MTLGYRPKFLPDTTVHDVETIEQSGHIQTDVTLNAMAGVITTKDWASYIGPVGPFSNKQFTLNNSYITADSVVFMSVAFGGTTSGVPVLSYDLGAGTADITITNCRTSVTGTGVMQISFWIVPTKPE